MILYKTLVNHKSYNNGHYFKFNSVQSTLMCVHVLLKHVHILSECHGCTAPCTHAQLQLLDLPTTSLILEQFYLIIHSHIKMIAAHYVCIKTLLLAGCVHMYVRTTLNSTSLMTISLVYRNPSPYR